MTVFLAIILVFLIVRFSVTVFNFLSNPKLPRAIQHHSDLVSILIPARNEAENILTLLDSITQQDYLEYEVIVLDDGSSDGTYNLVQDYSKMHSKFKVLKGQDLPAGWLGKNFACHQLAEQAMGKYLLFLDADDSIRRGLINSLLSRMKLHQLSLLSLFTNQQMKSAGERLTVPLMHFILLNLLPLRLVRLSKNPAFAAASGQCMFFNAADYNENQWHKRVKDQVVEDVELMKLVKQEKYNAEALLANGLIYCRMYQNLAESLDGFSKNLLAGFGNNILILLIYLLLVIAGPVVLILNFNVALLVLPFTLIVLSRIMIAYLSGQNVVLNVLLHPFQMLCLVWIAVLSIIKFIFKTGTWKGRKIQAI